MVDWNEWMESCRVVREAVQGGSDGAHAKVLAELRKMLEACRKFIEETRVCKSELGWCIAKARLLNEKSRRRLR